MKCNNGQVIWITGLSDSGKTTLANEVVSRLKQSNHPVISLDGDELRGVFGASAESEGNHARQARLNLAMKYSRLCYLLASQGMTVVIGTISLFREVHEWNRENLPGYFEVFLKVPMDELRRRDSKGIYKKFDSGELTNVAGLDLTVDEPQAADIRFDFEPERSIVSMTDELFKKISSN